MGEGVSNAMSRSGPSRMSAAARVVSALLPRSDGLLRFFLLSYPVILATSVIYLAEVRFLSASVALYVAVICITHSLLYLLPALAVALVLDAA
jgi:hypothetical protein